MITDGTDLELAVWRCGNCGGSTAPRLGLVTALGAVHLLHGRQGGGRRHSCPVARHTICDLAAGAVAVHCSACHHWRELTFDPDTQTFTDRDWAGYQPGLCPTPERRRPAAAAR